MKRTPRNEWRILASATMDLRKERGGEGGREEGERGEGGREEGRKERGKKEGRRKERGGKEGVLY